MAGINAGVEHCNANPEPSRVEVVISPRSEDCRPDQFRAGGGSNVTKGLDRDVRRDVVSQTACCQFFNSTDRKLNFQRSQLCHAAHLLRLHGV